MSHLLAHNDEACSPGCCAWNLPSGVEHIANARLSSYGAGRSDGVIHLAFNHDFSRFVQNCEDDRHVIAALGSVDSKCPS